VNWAIIRKVIMLALAAAIVGLLIWQRQNPKPFVMPAAPTQPLPIITTVPAFRLTERSGREAGSEELRGRVWVASFIFTTCPGPCREMSQMFATLQAAFKREGWLDVKLVSFTVDPENDTPDVLRRYADSLGADPERWWFLTGRREDIWTTSLRGFLLTVTETPEADVPKMGKYLHSTRFAVVDARGNMRGSYNIEAAGELQRLIDDVRRLREEMR
jgi:cytochrome oxidase Cu insertion factor (SCO1/SenC/PrrC family)